MSLIFRATYRTGLTALADAVRATGEGNRNHMLYWATIQAAAEDYEPEAIIEELSDAAREAGLERRETALTIKSGLDRATKDGLWGSEARPDSISARDWTPEQAYRAYEAWKAAGNRPPADPVAGKGERGLVLTSAANVTVRRVRWLWDRRLALGTMSLIGGREGQGKTLFSNDLAAKVTRGTLPGECFGTPRNVIIVTVEDSWDMTIVPRLMAAGADLNRVFRVEASTAGGVLTGLSLPYDLGALEEAAKELDVALVIMDPLMSRLAGNLDTHKDADVRSALEPLVTIADRCRFHLCGLIHVNKTVTSDPLTSLMGSRAFAAVVRAVLYVMRDPEEDGVRLIGQPKNNLGHSDFPTLRFDVDEVQVGSDPEDGLPITAPRMRWLDTTDRTVEDALTAMSLGQRRRSKADEAGNWLVRFLRLCPDGKSTSAAVHDAAKGTEHTDDHLRRAREKLRIDVIHEGFPKTTYWQLPIALWSAEDDAA